MAPETPRGVSSRLLTMKFMQRAVASSSPAGSPDSENHSSKKRKLGHSPPTGRIDLNIDQATIQAALDNQEATRQSALAQHVGSDTHWVLDNVLAGSQTKPAKAPMNIVYVGYGDIDSSNESDDNEDAPAKGRTSTSSYKKSKTQASHGDVGGMLKTADTASQQKKAPDNSDSSDDSSDDDSDGSNETSSRKRKPSTDSLNIQSERSRSRSRSKPRHSIEGAKAKEFRDKRKKKEVRLNKLTSISSAGGDKQFGAASKKNMTCYKCQQQGHIAADCPSSGTSRGRSRK